MKVSDTILTLKAQSNFERTQTGRSVSKKAIDVIDAILSDEKNWETSAIKCLNCSIILSTILTGGGCPNCGAEDLTTEIGNEEIIRR